MKILFTCFFFFMCFCFSLPDTARLSQRAMGFWCCDPDGLGEGVDLPKGAKLPGSGANILRSLRGKSQEKVSRTGASPFLHWCNLFLPQQCKGLFPDSCPGGSKNLCTTSWQLCPFWADRLPLPGRQDHNFGVSTFSEHFPLGEHAKWRCDTPPQKGYLSNTCATPYENKAKRVRYPLCDTISKGYCEIWGVSHIGPLRSLHLPLFENPYRAP